jgi:hypothetical protein
MIMFPRTFTSFLLIMGPLSFLGCSKQEVKEVAKKQLSPLSRQEGTKNERQPRIKSLKTIKYRGGIANFQIPTSWIEEYEQQGGGTFYEKGEDTGTLRVRVMDFERAADKVDTGQTAYEVFTTLKDFGEVERLPSGNAIAHSVLTAIEAGVDLRLHTWHIGVSLTPADFRIVAFTYTIMATQEHDPKMEHELKLLDRSIRSGEYPPVHGTAGDFVRTP